MSIISSGDTGSVELPEISNSLRFDGTNDYLTRAIAATGNRKTFLMRFCMKLGNLSTEKIIFSILNGNWQWVSVGSDGVIRYYYGGVGYSMATTPIFRDPTGWYDFVIGVDTTQTNAINRFKVFSNGVAQTVTTPIATAQNTDLHFNLISTTMWISSASGYGTGYIDGYLTNVCFIDGYPTGVNNSNWASTNLGNLFGYTDPNGQWRSLSKASLTSLVSAGGTNSFFLPFDNGSSTTTLGQDASSKGNNWTLNNMVRDGSVNDCWSYDTPTNNFSVNSQIDKNSVTISEGALKVSTGGIYTNNRTTFEFSSGKWYAEATYILGSSNNGLVGVCDGSVAVTSSSWNTANGWFYNGLSGNKYTNGAGSAYGAAYAANAVIGIAVDADAGTITFYKDGVSQGTAFTGLTGRTFAFSTSDPGDGPHVYVWNFGQRPVSGGVDDRAASGGYFRYTPPTGFKALCTKNLSSTGSLTTSGTFTGNAAADGPFVWLNGTPAAMTIDGNAVTWGTHADKLANGFKIRTASSPYNDAASNSYTVTTNDGIFKFNNAEKNP